MDAFVEVESGADSHILFRAKDTKVHVHGLDLDDLGVGDLILSCQRG